MKSKKLTLISIFLEKEKIFWKRIEMLTNEKANVLSKFLAILGVSFCRYGATVMHFLFECSMFVFNREQFKKNLKVLDYKTKVIFQNLKQ